MNALIHRARLCGLVLTLAACGREHAPDPARSTSSTPKPSVVRDHASTPAPSVEPPTVLGLPAPPPAREGLVHETRSEHAHLRIVDRGTRRELVFVDAKGEEISESAVDLSAPDLLVFEYTRLMFVDHLLRPRPKHALIVGLGGGSMVRFSRRFFPEVELWVVELDAAVVAAARDWFGVVEGPMVHVEVADGFEWIRTSEQRFDLIYMDAFLEPSDATDPGGAPSRMQTVTFLRELHRRLTAEGLLVVNLHVEPGAERRVDAMREVFATVYVFNGGGNAIVVGSVSDLRVEDAVMRERGRELDAAAEHGFSFEALARTRTDELF